MLEVSMPSRLRLAAMSLAEMLTRFHKFSVPDYQRVYAWGEGQVQLLLSDLEVASSGKDGELPAPA
jgi:hypothetical protein